MRHIVIAIIVTSLFYTAWLAGAHPGKLAYVNTVYEQIEKTFSSAGNYIAAVIMRKAVTVTELKETYNSSSTERKVRVLIVPGHEPDYGGTEFGSLKEREMNVELSTYLGEFLRNNGKYDVMLARDNKNWSPTLFNYFVTQWDSIITFLRESKGESLRNISQSSVQVKPKVEHNAARTDVALRLYGINKWANENAVDIVIHVHFNDYPRKNRNAPGSYSGLAVYIPEDQYSNSPTTRALSETIFKRLAKYNPVSNLPIENAGIVEEPDLIAIGAHNTSSAASMLIEYGYIYEPQFQNDKIRSATMKDLAFQTYLGLQDFFGSGNDVSFAYDTLMLPHSWDNDFSPKKSSPDDVLALQSALLLDGLYPHNGRTKNDCPRSGKIGPCTLSALAAFQNKYGIEGENGYVGEKTRVILNGRYSMRPI